jgi:hypothetical protein
MGREQMRNLEVTKIGGASQINEFEYQKHQGELTEQDHPHQQGEGGKRLTQAERIAQVTAAAHRKVEKKRKKLGAKPRVPKKASGSKRKK